MIGVDPGLTGAIAWYTPQRLVVWDMPITSCTKTVDGIELARYFDQCGGKEVPIIVEDVHSMPSQGVASMFLFGKNYGVILGVADAQGRKVFKVRPSVWKGMLGLSSNKEDSLVLARREFPRAAATYFSRKRDDGRAEAALLAKLGFERFNSASH